MAGLTEIADGEQATLLLYLVDELPSGEREQLEARLASDPALQSRLDALSQAHEALSGYLHASNAQTRLPTPASVAVARASRAIRQWAVERIVEAPPTMSNPASRWKYPAVAALLLAGIALAVAFHQARPTPQVAVINVGGPVDLQDDPSTPEMVDPKEAMSELSDEQSQALLEAFNRGNDSGNPEATVANSLDNADRAVSGLRNSDDLDNIFLGIAPDDRQETR